MADVVHHESESNSAMIAVILIVVIAIGAFLLWRYIPRAGDADTTPGVDLDVNVPANTNDGAAL